MVAVSGGIDSVVLLDLLYRLCHEAQISLIVGHVDHALRGEASARDASFVAELARSYSLPLVTHRLEPEDLRAARGQGREGAARHARLSALVAMAAAENSDRIALGHTADDQAETVLHRLTRGTGPSGLSGIPPVRLPFIRPLLGILRSEVTAYAEDRGLSWHEDESNMDLSLARNRIRHRVLPELRRINPQAVQAIDRAAGLVSELTHETESWIEQILATGVRSCASGALSLSRDTLRALRPETLPLIVREGLRQVRGTLSGISHAHIQSICSLATGPRSHGQLSIPGVSVVVQRDLLVFSTSPSPDPIQWDHALAWGDNPLPGGAVLSLQRQTPAELNWEAVRTDPWTEAADADRVSPPMHLRSHRSGDQFTPLGTERSRALQDFLTKQHTSGPDRERIPLLCDQNRIVWVVGVRLSDHVRVTNRTEHVALFRMKGME
jgi:tRNA(Ile)-lysidine synthase